MIDVNDKYIDDMLNQYPLSERNTHDLRDYTLDMVSGLTEKPLEEIQVPYEHHIDFSLPVKVKQKQIGCCNACASTANNMIMKSLDVALSWWFLYANREDSDYQGMGMRSREALASIKKYGITLLDLFNVMKEYPEIRDALNNDPNKDKIFAEAAKYKIGGYVSVNKEDVKKLICQGIPVMIGVEVYENFYTAINNGYVIPSKPQGKRLGLHEMLIVGYIGKQQDYLNWWDGIWDHNLYLDEDSELIYDYYIITDKPINKPAKIVYTVGWNKDGDNWTYSADGYKLTKGTWVQLKGKWYYLDENGHALTSKWYLYKDRWYYLTGDCSMKTGWLHYDNKWYYLELTNGDMLTGWFTDTDGKKYYLDIAKGYMYSNCTILIEGKDCTFDKSGALI